MPSKRAVNHGHTYRAVHVTIPLLSAHSEYITRHRITYIIIMKLFLSLCSILRLVTAAARTTAPSGALVVGKNGTYSTIQDAVDALSTSSTKEQIIFIEPGTYSEQVSIASLNGPLTIYGSTSDTSAYSSNEVIITAAESQATQSTNDLTATLSVHTSDFKMYNVKVVNSYGSGSQALALSAYAEVCIGSCLWQSDC